MVPWFVWMILTTDSVFVGKNFWDSVLRGVFLFEGFYDWGWEALLTFKRFFFRWCLSWRRSLETLSLSLSNAHTLTHTHTYTHTNAHPNLYICLFLYLNHAISLFIFIFLSVLALLLSLSKSAHFYFPLYISPFVFLFPRLPLSWNSKWPSLYSSHSFSLSQFLSTAFWFLLFVCHFLSLTFSLSLSASQLSLLLSLFQCLSLTFSHSVTF